MKFTSVVKLMVIGGFLATGIVRADGIEDGEKMCQEMPFSSDKMKCMTEVQKGRYYQSNAMDICRNFPFTREKMECLGKIRDKSYTPTLIQTCKDMTFSSKIIECLAQFGRVENIPAPVVLVPPITPPHYPHPYPAPVPENDRRAKKLIKKALKQMDRGNYYAARRILEDALLEIAE